MAENWEMQRGFGGNLGTRGSGLYISAANASVANKPAIHECLQTTSHNKPKKACILRPTPI
jgi:hypothetical protein